MGKAFQGNLKPPKTEKAAETETKIQAQHYLRTAISSRAELLFDNGTVARLGALTHFHFDSTHSDYNITEGEALFVFPKGKGGSTVSAGSVSAGILGTTVYLKRNRREVEYICLEGKCKIGALILGPGDRLVFRGSKPLYSAPKKSFDIRRFIRTNKLFTEFQKPLPSQGLIETEALKQKTP